LTLILGLFGQGSKCIALSLSKESTSAARACEREIERERERERELFKEFKEFSFCAEIIKKIKKNYFIRGRFIYFS